MKLIGADHKVRPRYLGPILTPSPSHTLSTISRPPKVRHTSRTPQFLVVQAYILCLYSVVCPSSREFFAGGFDRPGFFDLEGFVRGDFYPSHTCNKLATGIFRLIEINH